MEKSKNVHQVEKPAQHKTAKRISIKKPSKQMFLVIAIIVVLTLLVLLPILLKNGYFARLDGLITPSPRKMWTSWWFFTVPLASQLATLFMPMHIFWKVSIVVFFLLLGYSWYKLVKKDTDNLYAIWFAISLMMINPFVYWRFIDGQMNVYWILAIVPFRLLLLRTYFQKNEIENKTDSFPRKTLLSLLVLAVLWIGTSLHAVFMIWLSILVFALVYLPAWSRKIPKKQSLTDEDTPAHAQMVLAPNAAYKHSIKMRFWKTVALGMGIWIGSLYFVYMLFKPSKWGNVASFVKDVVDADHLAVFATWWKTLWVAWNILALRWYRWEMVGRFLPSYGENGVWFLLAGALFLLVVIGWIYYLKTHKTKAERKWQITFSIIAVLSFVLAMWTGQHVPEFFSQFNNWLFQHVPYYTGMREPQKRIVFLIPFYAYFGAFWVAACGKWFVYLWKKITNQKKESTWSKIGTAVFLLLLALIPSAYSYMMFSWFHGQIKMIQYPTDWYTLKDTLKWSQANKQNDCPAYKRWEATSCYDILNLPWHSYIGIAWVWGIVLNPMPSFFDDIKVLSADNIEIWPIYTQTQLPESRFIDSYLWPKWYFWKGPLDEQTMRNFVSMLKEFGIKQIFVIKQSPYKNLIKPINKFLEMKAIRLLHDSPTTSLFEIM